MQSFFFFDYFSIFKQQHSFGVVCSLTIMRYHDNCGALSEVEVREELDDLLLVLAVKVSCGFISKDEGRVVC